jgi:threonine/homoserine/homoserine lactone efflux protein
VFENLIAFALTALFISMVPGQGVAMVLRQGIVSGPRIARISILGNSTGLLIWSAASALGLSAIFAVSQVAFEILRWSGVAYLVFVSAQTLWSLRTTNSTFDLEGTATSSVGSAYRVGLITNLTNAKAMVFALALLPQYVPEDFNVLLGIMIFGTLWATISMSWYLVLVAIIEKSSRWLSKPLVRRWLTAASGVGIVLLAIGLALSPRS